MAESDCRPDRSLGSSQSIYHPCPQQPCREMQDRNLKTRRASLTKDSLPSNSGHHVRTMPDFREPGDGKRPTSLPATTASGSTTCLPATRSSRRSLLITSPSIASITTAAAPSATSITGITALFSPGTGISSTHAHVVILLRRKLEILELLSLGHELLQELGDILLGLE